MSTNLNRIVFPVIMSFLLCACGTHPGLDGFTCTETFHPMENAVQNEYNFDGYTTYWHNTSQEWTRYGNLFKTIASAPESAIIHSKFEIAGDMGMEGLSLQEGFVNDLLKEPYSVMEQPALGDLEKALTDSNVTPDNLVHRY
jgi:hypothetical protein